MVVTALVKFISSKKLQRLVKLKRSSYMMILVSFILIYILSGWIWIEFSQLKDSHDRSGLILDTPGCKIPKLDPYDETLKHIIKKIKKPYVCKGNPVFITPISGGEVLLNDAILSKSYNISFEKLSCSYMSIHRIKPTENTTKENEFSFSKAAPLKFGVPLDEEFIKIECVLGSKNYTQYLPLVPFKELKEESSRSAAASKNLLNVILIGIDSVSKLNFLRHFQRTHKFLRSRVSSLDMKGYTKVGDNTFPNLVPLLTGHFVEHYWNESLRKKMFFDNLDFIWKAYSKKGYRTFYAEDNPYYGTFQYLKRGFEEPPTDYYYRPMALALDKSGLQKKDRYCLNNQLEINMIYGYLKNFVNTMSKNPYFAFAMVSRLTHDNINDASYADEPTAELLEELWLNGTMNRSLTIIFSDHGIRFGKIRETYIGKIEERMPFMYLIFPEWFLKKYANVSENLKHNQNRLITLFDVHATLYHLLNLTEPVSDVLKSKSTSNGCSLLNKISEYRTCEMANILPHWCPCNVYQYMSPNDDIVIRAANALIDDINGQLRSYVMENICAKLEIEELNDARLGRASDTVLRFVEHKNDVINRYVKYGDKVNPLNDYLITITARPGGGKFEGTVRHYVKSDSFKVLGISRINMYGKQSRCISSQILKKFCFCP